MSQPEIYTVICIVVGEGAPFRVEIEKNKIVDQLKDLIKEKKSNTFADIDANLLMLYHVEIAAGEDMLKKVEDEMSKKPTTLDPTMEIADVFSETPRKRTVHILVQPPRSGKSTYRLS